MQNYGNYETQQLKMNYLNLDQKNVKKNQNQNEKLKKAVTYTLGALAGVGVAALIGYGIINKSQGKKVVDKAKDAASEAVNKGKDKINPSSQEKGKEVLFKVLADIQKGTPITLQDLRTAQTTLRMMVPSDKKFQQVVSKYLVLLDTLINQYKENGTTSFKVEGSLQEEAAKLETESHNVFTQALAQADFEAYLKNNHITLNKISLSPDSGDLVFVNEKQKVKLVKAEPSPKPNNLILLNADKKIYVMNNVYETKDDTQLYILHNKEYYTITAGDLKELADERNITEKDDVIKPDEITAFDSEKCEILKCKLDTEKEPALYIYGAKATATATDDELKYIKISKIKDNSEKLALLVDTNIFESIVKENDIATATWSAVLNENPDKFVDGDSLTKAGESLMAALNERINQAEKDTDKAKIITSALSGIDDDKFGDESVGKAVINSFVKNKSVTEAVLGAVFNTNPAKFVKGDGSLTNEGKSLMAALNEKINNAGDDKKAEIITSALNQIDATKFGDNSVGKAVVTSLMNNDEIKPEVFASVFNKVAEGRLVKDKILTEAGKALLDKMIEKGLSLDDLNSVVDGKIKNYQNDDKGIKTTNDEKPKLQVNRAKYYFNYLKNRKNNGGQISNTESLVLFSLLKDEKKGEYFTNTTLKPEKPDSYVEGDFTDDDVKYKDYSTTIHKNKIEVAKNVIKSGDASFIEKLPGYLKDLNDNELKELFQDKIIKDILVSSSTTKGKAELTSVGKAFLKDYAEKSGEIYNSIEYHSPKIRQGKSISEISIYDVTLKYYKYNTNTIRYFIETKKS